MPLTSTSTFKLGRRWQSSPQWSNLHRLRTPYYHYPIHHFRFFFFFFGGTPHDRVLLCWWYTAIAHDRWPFSWLSGSRCQPIVHQHRSHQPGGMKKPSRSPPMTWWWKWCINGPMVILLGIRSYHMTKEMELSLLNEKKKLESIR